MTLSELWLMIDIISKTRVWVEPQGLADAAKQTWDKEVIRGKVLEGGRETERETERRGRE